MAAGSLVHRAAPPPTPFPPHHSPPRPSALTGLLSGVRALLGNGTASAESVAAVLDDFERHADAYDGSYAERLASALTAAAS